MKFSQLPLGSRFRWQGALYCKNGPMTANADAGGAQRLIPRSAIVELADTASAERPVHGRRFKPERVDAAIAALCTRLNTYSGTLDDVERARFRQALDDALVAFRKALKR
jgi:hypothetical protein